jgi:hypothetical protein
MSTVVSGWASRESEFLRVLWALPVGNRAASPLMTHIGESLTLQLVSRYLQIAVRHLAIIVLG